MAFPNLRGKHSEEAMISPEKFIKYSKLIKRCPIITKPKAMILCYNTDLMNYIEKNYKTKKSNKFGGTLLTLKDYQDKIGIVGGFGIGAPAAAIVLEELIALGIKNFISIGTAGTLKKNQKAGNIILCERAIRDEGTSHHYMKTSKYAHPSKELTRELQKTLEDSKIDFTPGTTWTIDAPYRETVAEARQYQRDQVLTVEMEASALFAVAKYRKVKIATAFTVSDSLAELQWKLMFNLFAIKKGLRTLLKASIETLAKTI